MKTLIADDDPVSRRVLQSLLMKWGYEVVPVEDGEAAWRLLQSEDAPRLVILDWQMPGLDGVEVCRRVRARTDGAPYVYIILLTARDRREDIQEGMDAGADDYLTKPCDAQKLQVRLRAGRRILDLQSALLDSLSEVRQAEEALARAREREGQIGARIQQTLLLGQPPRFLPSIRVAPLTIPSQHIDGDFYDFFEHNKHCVDVVVGDVMGKGVPAALLGAAIKSHFLRALSRLSAACEPGVLPEPEEIVGHVHRELTGQFIGLDSFATLCYARFDLKQQRIAFVDCGHTKTIHFRRATGNCDLLEGEMMPLGFSEHEVYRQISVPFGIGDVFFFYSDGVTEAQNADGELFGVPRLMKIVRENSHLAPEELTERVRGEIVGFSGSERFADDLTCVAFKVEDPDGAAPLARAAATVPSALSELPATRAFVRRFCEERLSPPLEEDRIAQLELAVTEAASNVIRHAYEGKTDQSVRIEAEAFADRVCVHLHHRGKPFDPETVPPPRFDGTREGGFGVYMIARSVDEVRYTRDEAGGGSAVHLVKYRHTSGGGDG